MNKTETEFKTLMCLVCGWIYSEKDGAPGEGLAPGTRWDGIPDSWTCPDCGVKKEDFTVVEI